MSKDQASIIKAQNFQNNLKTQSIFKSRVHGNSNINLKIIIVPIISINKRKLVSYEDRWSSREKPLGQYLSQKSQNERSRLFVLKGKSFSRRVLNSDLPMSKDVSNSTIRDIYDNL